MSLLAAFVAMLGKQWLNRYLRHAGGSMVERCGDRQRKFDGLEKWPFRLFIESLPIMLQIALFLLTCGLSRYMWSVNTPVAHVVISFTVLGILFYIGIVAAGTSSYECPFQTPASTTLRYLRDSGMVQKLFASLSLCWVTSLISTTLGYTWQRLVSASHHVHNVVQYPLSWEVSLSHIMSGIHSIATKLWHQTIILFLQADRLFWNAEQRLVQGFWRFIHAGLFPITSKDTSHQTLLCPSGSRLQVHVRNVESIWRQNIDNALCVCWVLRNITDPEAIDSAIRLAGTIQWFSGGFNYDPPFDLIVSTFEACFDSSKHLYPGMRDRAYFSALAILQINMGARAQSHEQASKYPIPVVSLGSFQHTDPDLYNVLHMLELNLQPGRPTLTFPRVGTNTLTHLLWMSNLFVAVTHAGPNPTLESYQSYLSAAATNHQPMIANILLMWYMFLGGHVEEDTLWAVDKSYALVLLSLPSVNLTLGTLGIHWKLSFLTCLQKWWMLSLMDTYPNISTTSWYFWQHGWNGLSV